MISIITTLFVITTLVSLKGLITNATVASRPEFDIAFSPIPESAKVGEDIVVKGTITPKPFEIPVPEKEIVFVVDTDINPSGIYNQIINNAKNFIQKIHDEIYLENSDKINSLKNLKIGIVSYSTNAEIRRININSTNQTLVDVKYGDDLKYTIGHLLENGNTKNIKTNTGEGLRKALYLLNSEDSSKYANKTIILISDSSPTARTVYNKNSGKDGEFYLDSTSENYINATTGNTSNSYYDLEYAKEIGKLINDKGYNVFTIGHSIDKNSEAAKALKEIHKAMSGNDMSDNLDDENNGLFITNDTEVVQNIFSKIESEVLSQYNLNSIDMKINFTGDFSLNVGGNTIDLTNINYELKSVSNGKARYEADPIPFEFVIKGNKEGYQQIFDKVTITYPWQGLTEKVDINSELFITIKPNELPSIVPKLISSEKIEVKKDEEITLKYQITPEDFVYNNVSNSGEKDVLFLIDTSVKGSSTTPNFLERIFAEVLQKLDSNTKYAAITFNSTSDILFDFNYIGDKDSGDYANSINQRKFKNIKYSGEERNIGKAFNLVAEVFKTGRATASKNLVILSNDDVTYVDSDYNKIKENNYNIVTVSYQYKNIQSNLYNIHKLINGKEENILFPQRDFNEIYNNLPGYVRDRLQSFSTIRPYLINPVLNLNLGNNFNPISGIVKSTESGKNNIGIVEVPTITYNLTQNNNYHAESKIIEIKIKANNLSPGIYTLGNITDNKMIYKTLLNKDVSMTIKTPIIIVKDEIKDVNHGLYNGIDNGQVSISADNNGTPFEIAQGSTVTFGANFTFSGSSTEFNLNVDNKFSDLNPNNIKIYKVSKDSSGYSTLKELDATNKSIVVSGDNKFKISINNITESSTEILVVYQGKIIDSTASGQTLINDIVFGSTSKNATIVTPKQSTDSPILPDLF